MSSYPKGPQALSSQLVHMIDGGRQDEEEDEVGAVGESEMKSWEFRCVGVAGGKIDGSMGE